MRVIIVQIMRLRRLWASEVLVIFTEYESWAKWISTFFYLYIPSQFPCYSLNSIILSINILFIVIANSFILNSLLFPLHSLLSLSLPYSTSPFCPFPSLFSILSPLPFSILLSFVSSTLHSLLSSLPSHLSLSLPYSPSHFPTFP